MPRRLFFIIAFLLFGNLYAQKAILKGVVQDASSSETLIGVNIYLINDISIGGTTDINGEYQFLCPIGKQKIGVSFIGMVSDTLDVLIQENQENKIKILLTPDAEILETFKIEVGKFNKKVEDLTVSMEVIKSEVLEEKNIRSVETILEQTPGVNILDGEPQIRGGSGFTFGVGSKVAVIVDDMPMLSGDAGRPLWDFVPIENIEQIEIIKGASSVLSGASALSGSIHIRTAEPSMKPSTKVSIYSGFYSAPKDTAMKWWDDYPYIHGAKFSHSEKIKNLNFVIGGLINNDHGYIGAPNPGKFVVDTVTDFDDSQMKSEKMRVNLGLKYYLKNFERLNFGVNVNAMQHSKNLTLAWNDDSTGFYRAYPGGVILQNQIVYNIDPFVNLLTKNNGKHSLKGRVLITNDQMNNDQQNFSELYFIDYQYKKEFEKLKDLEFIVGTSYSKVFSRANLYEGRGTPINVLKNSSLYAEVRKTFKEMLSVSIGYRREAYWLNTQERDDAQIFRGGLNLKLTEGTNIRGSYGQGYRFPTIAERYIKTSVGSFGVFDNPDLKPEKSWNMEAGIRQGYKVGKFHGYLDVAGFKQEYENTIEYLFGFWDSTYTFAIAGFKFLNTGKSRVTGIDASAVGTISTKKKSGVTFMIAYSYIKPVTLEPDVNFAKDFKPGGSGDFSYNATSTDSSQQVLKYRFIQTIKGDLSYTFRKIITLGVSGRYYSKIDNYDKAIVDFEEVTTNTGGSLQAIKYVDYYDNSKPEVIIFDARASVTFQKKHKISVIINNLMNETYSLRPLKAESLRTTMFQYTLTI
jgi:outer membrane receptor protein involved in Fe transport